MRRVIGEKKSLVLMLCAIAFMMAVSVGSVGATSLVVNGGFEDPWIVTTVGGGPGTNFAAGAWSFYYGGVPGEWWNYAGQESQLSSSFHSGSEAMFNAGEAAGAFVQTYQDIAVNGGQYYNASVWARAYDLNGTTGFGHGAYDHIALWLLEFDSTGNLLVNQAQHTLTTATSGFVQLTTGTFKTNAATTSIRYILETQIGTGYWGGRTVLDDASLVAVPEPSSILALLSGVCGLGGLAWRRKSA